MSPNAKAPTSPARNPRRASAVTIAKSRRPSTVRRSQLRSKRPSSLGLMAFGNEASCQPATDGTAAASSLDVWPSTYKKRSSDRMPVTVALADPRDRRPHSRRVKPMTSSALRSDTARSCAARSTTTLRATPT